jgi:hypothetical protein
MEGKLLGSGSRSGAGDHPRSRVIDEGHPAEVELHTRRRGLKRLLEGGPDDVGRRIIDDAGY